MKFRKVMICSLRRRIRQLKAAKNPNNKTSIKSLQSRLLGLTALER
jgi:hypothetical protein